MSPRTFALTTIQHSTPRCLGMPITFQYSSNVIRYFFPFDTYFFFFSFLVLLACNVFLITNSPSGNIACPNIALITELFSVSQVMATSHEKVLLIRWISQDIYSNPKNPINIPNTPKQRQEQSQELYNNLLIPTTVSP